MKDIHRDGMPRPFGTCHAPQWFMKSATAALFGESGTATLPPRSPGCDNARAFGPAGLVVGRRRGLGQGSLEEPDGLMEAVRRESGTVGKRRRYSLTGTALRAHLLWAESGLGSKIPPGSRVLVTACRTGTASV